MNIFWNNTHFFIMAEISLNWFGGKIENFQPELFTITYLNCVTRVPLLLCYLSVTSGMEYIFLFVIFFIFYCSVLAEVVSNESSTT